MLRTTLLVTLVSPLALLAAACAPDVAHNAPTNFATAVFDPTTSQIPLPNDLAFLNPLNTVCGDPTDTTSTPAKCAQAELLGSFDGKFPSDQDVAITIDFTQTTFDDNGQTTNSAPDLDLTSFTPDKFFVYGISGGAQGEAALEPLSASSYVKGTTKGTLTIHHKDFAPWAGGSYVAVVRGGPDGVKTKDGSPIYASQVFSLIEQGQDMTNPKNLGLLKAQYGTTQALALGAQLNQVINLYKGTVFPVADMKFPHEQLAIALTFSTQAEVTNVSIDPDRSLVPLPIDLLRDPVSGHLTDQAACAFLSSSVDPATGKCTSAAAGGFLALDGFSTTGAILAPTSELIEAKTIDGNSLRLYDLSDKNNPVQVPSTSLILEPCEFTSGCGAPNPLSPVIAIQPAGASAGDPASVFLSKPLKDNTDYAVVMTTAILDKAGNPIGPGTVAKIVRFKNPIAVAGKSQLVGIADTTAQQLENMRLLLAPLLGQLASAGLDSAHLGMAYTFHTQTILSTAVKLAALPYTEADGANTTAIVPKTPTEAFDKYGVDATHVPGTGAGDHINEILETDITTFNLLDTLTGAFKSDPAMATPETIHVLIATPKPAAVTSTCSGVPCAPLIVFRHGLGGGRADMLTVADGFTAKGMVVVAIDAAKHGDRSYCTPGSATTNIPGFAAAQCAADSTCVTALPAGAQGDAEPPGQCVKSSDMTTPGEFAYRPVSTACALGACPGYLGNGIPFDSSNYLVTSNFFRTRDTFRQDFIDESELVRAIAYVPTTSPPTGHNTLFDYMLGTEGLIIDPATVYFAGQSLGSIQGVGDVATNPRISKAAFNVGGGTVVDIFTNSPSFVASTLALLQSLGIQPGTSAYIQFLVVAKTVLDPADPVNYADHLTEHTLPDLLTDSTGATSQVAKKVLSQIAFCDQTVPNPFEFILAENFGTVGPLPIAPGFGGGTGTFSLFWNVTSGGAPTPAKLAACTDGSTPGAVEHGFVTDWKDPLITQTAQSDIASFLTTDTNPPSIQALP